MRARRIQETIQTYLVSIGTVYLFAFVSLYVQVPGLYGRNGILPIDRVIPKLEGSLSILDHAYKLYSFPSVLIYYEAIGLPSEYMMELICLVGVVLSISVMLFTSMRCSLIFLILWALYISLHQVGQTFLYFQWDSLLLETGIITVIVAPLNFKFWKRPSPKPHDPSSLWLVRWLLFRLMFASGVVKLTSQCMTWWGLTALNWHYESQCIPTPLAWYAHQLPEWFQKLSVVGTYAIEILIPFLFFVPVRSLRLFSFWSQVFFQLCIIATGNYNFFNILTIVLCVSLLDDDFLITKKKRKVVLDWTRRSTNSCFGKDYGRRIHALLRLMIFVAVVGGLSALCCYYFDMSIKGYQILSQVAFSKDEFWLALSYAVPAAALLGCLSLTVELLYAIWDSLAVPGLINKVWSMLQTLVMGAAILGIFSVSLVSLAVLNHSLHSKLPNEIIDLNRILDPLQITNSYGLFRRMTGVGGRPELIIEGSNDPNGPWKEYDFLYKPGNVAKPPPFVFPHQPRLDWQMWFAALGHYQHNPWLVNLVYKLLKGQEEVMELMAPPPFEKPPHFIKVDLYTYHYTQYNQSESLFRQSGQWWTREHNKEYMFSLSVDHSGLLDYLKQNGFSSPSSSSCPTQYLCAILDQIRTYSRLLPPHVMIWTLYISVLVTSITMTAVSEMLQNSTPKEKKKEQTINKKTREKKKNNIKRKHNKNEEE